MHFINIRSNIGTLKCSKLKTASCFWEEHVVWLKKNLLWLLTTFILDESKKKAISCHTSILWFYSNDFYEIKIK